MKARFSVAVIASVFFIALSSGASAQVPAVPDYLGWEKDSGLASAVHNGKEVKLPGANYGNYDESKDFEQVATVINNEDGGAWLLFYSYLQHTLDHQNEKIYTHLFEWQNGGWAHVQDFSDSTDRIKDRDAFLKSKYDLEFKVK